MSVIVFGPDGRGAAGLAVCDSCGYPYPEAKCPNPACRTNRTPAQNAVDDAAAAQRRAEEVERQRLAKLRGDAMRGSHGRPRK